MCSRPSTKNWRARSRLPAGTSRAIGSPPSPPPIMRSLTTVPLVPRTVTSSRWPLASCSPTRDRTVRRDPIGRAYVNSTITVASPARSTFAGPAPRRCPSICNSIVRRANAPSVSAAPASSASANRPSGSSAAAISASRGESESRATIVDAVNDTSSELRPGSWALAVPVNAGVSSKASTPARHQRRTRRGKCLMVIPIRTQPAAAPRPRPAALTRPYW